MKGALIILLVFSISISGCFMDDLIGTGGDDSSEQQSPEQNPPVKFSPGKEMNPDKGVYHGDCQSERKC